MNKGPTDPSVLNEVPRALKKLVRIITRGFYTLEEALLIDILIHHPCMKEDDLIDLLKFEKKQLRQAVTSLKCDKFIKVRMRVETDSEGKLSRHNYYFINYSVLVNVVKYKVDQMRKRIEAGERQSTCRASFICPACEKTYSDLEADQLFDTTTLTFICTFCRSEVHEEEVSQPKTDARALMVKFNEQLEPIFALLMEVENIKLSHEILEPEPTDFKRATGGKSSSGPHQTWSGDATKNRGFGDTGTDTKITIGDDQTDERDQRKERPIWMRESTVLNTNDDSKMETTVKLDGISELHNNIMEIRFDNHDKQEKSSPDTDNIGLDIIMKTLMAHERTSQSAPPHRTTAVIGSKFGSHQTASDEETDSDTSMEGVGETVASRELAEEQLRIQHRRKIALSQYRHQAEERDITTELVVVGERHLYYDDITELDIDLMTQREKLLYCRLGAEMYNEFYM